MNLPSASDFRKRTEVYKNRIWIPHELNFAEPTPSLIMRKINGKDYMLSSEFYCVDDKDHSSGSISGPCSSIDELSDILYAAGVRNASDVDFPQYKSEDMSDSEQDDYCMEYVSITRHERELLDRRFKAMYDARNPRQLRLVHLDEEHRK